MKPELDAHGVALVGIGLEELGLEEFLAGKFFNGDLYLDVDKSCYKGLNLRRHGITSGFGLLDSRVFEANKKAGDTPGNMAGDGMQLGATFVVEKGGRVLFEFRQEYYGHEAELDDIRQALGIPIPEASASSDSASTAKRASTSSTKSK